MKLLLKAYLRIFFKDFKGFTDYFD